MRGGAGAAQRATAASISLAGREGQRPLASPPTAAGRPRINGVRDGSRTAETPHLSMPLLILGLDPGRLRSRQLGRATRGDALATLWNERFRCRRRGVMAMCRAKFG